MAGSRRKITTTKNKKTGINPQKKQDKPTKKTTVTTKNTKKSGVNKQKTTSTPKNTQKFGVGTQKTKGNPRKQMTEQAQEKQKKYADNTTKFVKKSPQLVKGAVQQSVGGLRQAVSGTVSNSMGDAKNTTGKSGVTARMGTQGASRRGSNDRNVINNKRASKEQQKKNAERTNKIREAQKEGAKRSSELASKQIARGTANIEDAKKDLGKGGKYMADLLVGGTQLAGDIALGVATGGTAMPAMFMRAYGLGLDSAQKEGASGDKAMLYGLASAGLEVATEKLGNIAAPLTKSFGKGLADDFVDRVVKKMSKQSTTNLAYHGGKTLMAAVTEGLEEMIAEGLDPAIANAIYAEAIGKPHSTTLGEVLYSGAVGAGLGGILGGGSQIVEYSKGKKISDKATELYGEGGINNLIDEGLDIDEDAGGSLKAETYKEMATSGGGIAMGQVYEMARDVEAQRVRDENRFLDADNAANKEIEKQNLDNIFAVDENGEVGLTENAQGIFNENLKNNVDAIGQAKEKLQLPEMSEEQVRKVAEVVASVQTGIAMPQDISLFTLKHPENRAILEEVMGVKLPETNQDTKTMLFEMVVENRVKVAESQTAWRKDAVRGMLLQDIAPAYGSAGQGVIVDNVDTINADNLSEAEMYLAGFDNAYNSGRAGWSYEEYDSEFKDTARNVPENILRAAHEAGLEDRRMASEKAERVQLKLGRKVEKSRSNQSTGAHRGKLTVDLAPENKGKFGAQEQIFYKAIAGVLNIEIRIVDNLGSNGTYTDGVITMDVNGDRNLSYIFFHELTHHLEKYAPQEYQKLKETLRKRWIEKDEAGYRNALEQKKSQYAKQNIKLTDEMAFDEILADGTYEFLQDEDFMNELCRKDRGVAQALLDALRMLINKIRAILVNGDRFTPKQNEALYSNLDILKEMESLWADALAQAVQNRGVVGTVSEMESVEDSKFNDKDILDEYGITKLNDYVHVQKRVLDTLEEDFYGEVTVESTGMVVDIGRKGIKETFGSGKRFQTLPRELKLYKLAVIKRLPEIIKKAQLTEGDVKNKHGDEKTSTFDYLETLTEINGIPCKVKIDIKKSHVKNKFWMHMVEIENEQGLNLPHHNEGINEFPAHRHSITDSTENGKKKWSLPDDEFDTFIDSLTDEEFDEILGDLFIENAETTYVSPEVRKIMSDIESDIEEDSEKPRYKEKTTEQGKVAKLTDERIERLFNEYGASNPKYAKAYITSIHPRDFLSLTLPDESFERWDKAADKGESKEFFALDLEKLKSETQTPFLEVNTETGRVEGHEGRHRMRALLEAGVTEVPIAVIDYRTKYTKELRRYLKLTSQSWLEGPVNDNASAEVGYLIPINEVNRDEIKRVYGGEGDVRFSVPDTDSTGRELSEGQQSYFANSQARDKEGRLVPVFHTTKDSGFTIFDPEYSDDKISLFFSNNFKLSQTYAPNANKPALSLNAKVNPDNFNFEQLRELCKEEKLYFITVDTDGIDVHYDIDAFVEAYESGNADNIEWVTIMEDMMDMSGYDYKIVKDAKTVEGALGELLKEFPKDYAQRERRGGYYEVYLNLKNPFIVDGRGRNWNDIYAQEEDNGVAGKVRQYAELTRTHISDVIYYDEALESLGELESEVDKWNTFIAKHDMTPFSPEVEAELRKLGKEIDDDYSNWIPEEHLNSKGQPMSMQEYLREYTPVSMTTRQIAKHAYNNDYDGVIIKNIFDNGPYGANRSKGDIYIAFNSEQVKDVNNLNPTEDPDIRYSLQDSEGRELSEGQQEYFAESVIRDENGRLKRMYHGSPETFTIFEPIKKGGANGTGEGYGIYLTDTAEIAQPYANNGKMYEGYVNITKPATSYETTISKDELIQLIQATCEVDAQEYVDDGSYDTIEEGIKDTWISNYTYTYDKTTEEAYNEVADMILDSNQNDMEIVQEVMFGFGANSYSSAYKFYDILKETLGIDGFVTSWEYEGGTAEIALAFNSNQFKNIDNLNPTEDPDIRYSLPDSDDVYDYVNSNETEFVDVPPTRDYEKEFARVKDQSVGELKKQVEKLQAQTKLTHGKVLDSKSVAEEINMLIKALLSYNEGTKKTDHKLIKLVQENAKSIYTDVKNGNIEDAAIRAWDVSTEVIENLQLINDEMYQEYKELRNYLRQTKINFPEGFPHAKEFRADNMGRLKLVKEGGRSVDDVYQELLGLYPGMFDETIDNVEDQLQEIADVRGSLEPYDIVLSEEETNQLIKETAHDILDIAVHGKPWKSWADRQAEIYDERTKKLKARHKEALRDVRTKMKEKADERVKAERDKAKNKAEAEKMANARKQAEQKRAQQESKERKNAEAEKRRHITRIEKDLKWLSDRLLKPTDDKHLPDGYQKAIAELLMMVDPQTARSKKLEEKYGPSKKRLNFLKLKAEYENIAKNEADGMIYNEDISNWCEQLGQTLDDAGSIADATVEEMRVIRQLVRAIAHSIREQNQAFDENLKAGISELAVETIHKAKTSRKTGQRGGIPGALGTLLNESMVTPRDFFEGIGGGLHKVFMSIRKGHDRHVDNITEARTFFAELFGEYANKKKPGSEIENWRNHKTNETFKLEGGTITMNVAQKMALYCSLKREQAAGHIFGSGIVVAEASTMTKLKEALGAKKEINYGTTRITMEEAYDIVSTLSSEQIEIADKLQEFLNGRCAEWGNEASLKMFGYKKFTEPNYFPIQSADVYLDSNFEGRQTVERIRNFGFTKGTVVNANNPIVIDDIFTVVADHVNKMSMYNAFAAPIADFTRVYNFKTRNEEGLITKATKDVLANTYGKKVGRYINNFIADLQSNTQTRSEGFTRFVNKTLANYKKATIAANVRVALQQPTAIIRAFTLIDPKYFVLKNHTPELLKKAKGEDTDYKEMLEHCPIARWKSWGFSQVDMARDLDDIMMNKEWQKLDLVTMEVYGVLDLYTWSKIWGAVKAETKAKRPDVEVGSEEFYAICNERASEIFDKTQVVDSVVHKSQVMRNTDTMSKVLTSFMAEPTRTYNMVRSEYASAMDMWAEGDKAKATAKVARASSVYLLNALACAAAAAVADALRGKDLDGDDEEEEWYELTLANFMSNANPLNLLPVFNEIPDIWKGWDTSNMALEGIEALIKAEKEFINKLKGDSDKTWGEVIRKQAEAIGLVSGVPVKNILREVESFGKIVGLDVFAAEKGEEEKLLDFNLINNGSGFDNFLNGLGINLSESEKFDRNFDRTVKSLNKATKNMTEAEKQEYLWKEITSGYTTELEAGNYVAIDNMRRLLKATGGDYEKFNESIISKTKTAMKKTIGVDVAKTEEYRHQLRRLGMTDAIINQEVVMKSDAAKAFQLEACEDDYDGMVETIRTLYDAGLTETELDVLYYNRTKAINANDYRTGELIAPCNGEITSTFGYRNAPTAGASSNHKGIDIAVASNSDIAAADGGKVSSVGYNKGYGYYVKISHGNGRYTMYAHLNGYYVQKGQAVSKGDVIALSGSTGVSTGPHLHFEVIENGINVDPLPYLQ